MKTTISIIAAACLCACTAPNKQTPIQPPQTAYTAPAKAFLTDDERQILQNVNLPLTDNEKRMLVAVAKSLTKEELFAGYAKTEVVLLPKWKQKRQRGELTTADINQLSFGLILENEIKRRGLWDEYWK